MALHGMAGIERRKQHHWQGMENMEGFGMVHTYALNRLGLHNLAFVYASWGIVRVAEYGVVFERSIALPVLY